jgi:hypothetical protein
MIAEQDWKRLLADVAAKLPGASMAEIKSVAFDTLHEFFKDSSCWIETLTVPVTPASTTYDLVVGEGQLVRLLGVLDANNQPVKALMPAIGQLQLAFSVNTNQTYTAYVALNVTLPLQKGMQPVAPDWVLPLWGPYITQGIIGNMMNVEQRTYSSVRGAAYNLKRFRDAISQARTEALSRYTLGGAAWRFPGDFSTRGQKGGISTGTDTRFTSWP